MHTRGIVVLSAWLLLPACKDDPPPATSESEGAGTTTASASSAPSTSADASTGPSASSDGADTTAATPGCGTDSAAALARCVDTQAIEADVTFIAEIRTPGTPHWLAVQELCADRLTMLGFTVELHEYGTGINVIGRLPGSTNPDEVVLIGAHYDHVADCLGADDNASGVGGALEAARVLATADDRPRTLAVACWDEEELGLVGSEAWVDGGQAPGETIVAYFNYDMIGYATNTPDTQEIPFGFDAVFPEQYMQVEANEFRGDFILNVADDLATAPAQAFDAHAASLGLTSISVVLDAASKNSDLFSDLRRSDHAPFWFVDIPALFLTDTANFRNPAYHCASGQDDLVAFDFAALVVGATVGAAAETLGVPP
ncbi:M28 family metallopeptidase [Paraliomyxa miuraensis]|uniref:M28 family metallopeptidase n=1 Tax=Paraliomyxa miuraensis TaxID=376150 RepID=UPI00225770DC|nr:M28 family peptidase [Paraliomyxa miuraensis]MCX4247335.1 M28 family peptidase [Paraliomyxa miuraensis]